MSDASKIDESKLGINPFLDYLRIWAIRVDESRELFEKDSGVVVSIENKANITTIREYDVEHYFRGFNKSENRLSVMGLSAKAKDLLWFIVYELKAGRSYVVVNVKRYLEEVKVSRKTYRRAVLDLIAASIIAPTSITNVFYINPAMFFNGNRIKKFPEKVLLIDKK